jgi:Family of unknown function (DUF6807)
MSFRGAIAMMLAPVALAGAASTGVKVLPDEAARKVDVLIDGKPFTSYIWPTSIKKPVLYPIRTAKGTIVTRGWPLDPRPGERVDHPHHVGLWLNYENVNGLDFWNNSEAIKPADAPKMGTIVHRRIVDAKSGADRGELVTESDWVNHDGKALLHERTQFVFAGGASVRRIDRVTTLTAADERVVFADAKDGMLGLRVARQLEQPSKTPEVFTDAAGRSTAVPVLDNKGVTGEYISSEGLKGDAVWSTRGRWTLLHGTIENEPVTIAILDHPSNPGFPTYWHARGYGLFAANPLGQKAFSNGKQELNFSLPPGASARFRYRVLILSNAPTPEIIEREYQMFAQEGSAPTGHR